MTPASTPPPQRVHVIFKTHLDVGYTDFARNVIAGYFNNYIPQALELARSMRERDGRPGFVWTTGSWLIYEYLEWADASARRVIEAAIAAGDIAWHALPFTFHSENLDPDLFRFGLQLSQELDRRFGKRTIAAKMTDVPGHTRGIVPLLAEAGVQFLHIGVNGASTAPSVPPVFRWRDPASGAEVMVMYHHGYGDTMVLPGLKDAIAFAHTNDNLGPQDEVQVQAAIQRLRKRLPGAEMLPSTMDAFAVELAAVRDSLPVLTAELGDAWIHGVGTDPAKEARYRALSRLRAEWLARGVEPSKLHDFSRKLLPVPEHTWGLDIKTHLRDFVTYRSEDFKQRRSGENYHKVEESWREQRAYLDEALAVLPDPALRVEAGQRLAELSLNPPDLSCYAQFNPAVFSGSAAHFAFKVDPLHGGLVSLRHLATGRDWAGLQHPLARFWYQTFSAGDYRRYFKRYIVHKARTAFWAYPDFCKPGLEESGAESRRFDPTLTWAGQRVDADGLSILSLLEMPSESVATYGAPRRLALSFTFPSNRPAVEVTLQWFDKPATRLPEAMWLTFQPRTRRPHEWQLNKLGQWISPLEVVHNGNRRLHAVQQGARYLETGRTALTLLSPDVPLVAPGTPALVDFTNRQPALKDGLHFNLFNNQWGTNFPMWYEEDGKARFTLLIG